MSEISLRELRYRLAQRVSHPVPLTYRCLLSSDWLKKYYRLYTLNTHYLSNYTEKFLAYYKGARRQQDHGTLTSTLENPSDEINTILSGLNNVGIPWNSRLGLASLKIMADVRAYFQVAYKRFASIDYDFVRGLHRGLL
ncbi:uncharacterized protein BT62DRAFT_1007119 [Guyanagaster necrorhizus]|uniref:Uncharacterized protein n=1 Tax=Guyanagaster necrorhizus TaxID=856835 RepID=A0A9P8ARG9_9AGAR|nr:uncharacterized protein BT62DRAFT_1007119 [Guyanagaster necrorhizus MCA 3950]KAG7445383.1 hypothetical protein BT62DRAFT_1007119 [Guyanagaster necrorhizus MCA 3950]